MACLSWKVYIGLILVAASTVMSLLHIAVFGDSKTLFFYLALDIVFVPVQVLLVTIIIERFLSEREKQSLMKKLNMVIGAFFSEVGNALIQRMGSTCADFEELEKNLAVSSLWNKSEYRSAIQFIEGYECRIDSRAIRLTGLRDYLVSKRSFVLGLLQNPNLLEHDDFTDLLWAICHLTEELEARSDFDSLPSSDLMHLEGDIQRAFGILVREWLSYMQHLKENYPYMYSLAVRINPFNSHSSPVVLD